MAEVVTEHLYHQQLGTSPQRERASLQSFSTAIEIPELWKLVVLDWKNFWTEAVLVPVCTFFFILLAL